MFDIISIGDATIDTLVGISDANVACSIDKSGCMLQLRFADKLPVETIAQKVAGNAANNAIGCARMGYRVAMHTMLGADPSGHHIERELVANGVSSKFIEKNKKDDSNASTVINFKGERTILVYHAPRKYRLPKLPKAKWAYYTSVGENHKKYNAQVITYVKKHGVKLGYNPGTYQFLEGKEQVRKVCAVAEVLFVNVEEAARIVGKKKDIKAYHRALHRLGTKIVVITDGRNGSYVFDGKTHYQMGIYTHAPVIERTGAGDSYAVGFISARMDGKDISEAMRRGNVNSTSVISKIGPQDGLLKKTQLKRFERKLGGPLTVKQI